MHQGLQGYLYHSELAPDYLVNCVSDIVKEARDFNEVHKITGLLMFDGHRFAQYIEGAPENIDLLVSKIIKDPRHTNFTQQYNGLRTNGHLFSTWSMAYIHLDSPDPLTLITSLRGDLAMRKLEEMLPALGYG
ncbi:MAG: BLUF domain-containing protein [Comamonas sp.]|uniref:BLUF domain-containing protein n=1 Tax=Comamonas sp. TaxID=34028 RepID=UPI002FC80166